MDPIVPQDVLMSVEFCAKKLAVLLYASSTPARIKEAWIALLPHMNVKQIARLLDIFEAKYANEKTKAIDEEYKKKLAALVQDFNAAEQRSEVGLIKQIDALI